MSAAADEAEVPTYRLYTCEQGAARINSDVISAWTLYRLAREELVPCTRNGRKIAWPDEPLAGAVAYLASAAAKKAAKAAKKSAAFLKVVGSYPRVDPSPTKKRK